jgi:hypothetical protein
LLRLPLVVLALMEENMDVVGAEAPSAQLLT